MIIFRFRQGYLALTYLFSVISANIAINHPPPKKFLGLHFQTALLLTAVLSVRLSLCLSVTLRHTRDMHFAPQHGAMSLIT